LENRSYTTQRFWEVGQGGQKRAESVREAGKGRVGAGSSRCQEAGEIGGKRLQNIAKYFAQRAKRKERIKIAE